MASATSFSINNVGSSIKSINAKLSSELIRISEKLAKMGFEVVSRDSQLVVKLGRDRQVEGFYNIAIIVKDPDAEKLSETLSKVLKESLTVRVAACPFCKSIRMFREQDKYACENYHAIPKEVPKEFLNSITIAFVQVDAAGKSEDRELIRILKYGASGDKAEVKTSGEVVLNELVELVHNHMTPVLADMLKLIVGELNLAVGSIEYHVKKLEKKVEKEEARADMGFTIDAAKLQALADLGISRETALALLQIHTLNRISERQSRALMLVVKAILEKFRYVKAFYVGDSHSRRSLLGIYCFDELRWASCEVEILNFLSELYKKAELDVSGVNYAKLRNDVEKFIADNLKDYLREEPLKIAFKNCIWDWELERCTEPNPEEYVYHLIPWKINTQLLESLLKELRSKLTLTQQEYEAIIERYASTRAPKTLKAFKDWVGDKWVLLFEIIGVTLWPSPLKKAILLIDAEDGRGKGDRGKSTYLRYLEMLLGSENKSSVPLQKLLKERFASILIFRKLANIYADLREDIVENLGEFKAYTGEDTVVIEDKFKRPFNWRPYVKHIFSKNDPPNIRVDEADDAFWNRWIIVEFIGNFTKKIYKFEETLADEIPNVIPIAIACFLVVKRRGLQFSYASTIEEVKNIWLSRINTIYGFINWVKKNKLLRPATGMPTFTDVIYNIYTRWCEANDKMPETQANFTKELKRMGFAVVRDRSGRSKVKNYILDADAAEKLVNAVLGEESTENTQGQSLFRETLM